MKYSIERVQQYSEFYTVEADCIEEASDILNQNISDGLITDAITDDVCIKENIMQINKGE